MLFPRHQGNQLETVATQTEETDLLAENLLRLQTLQNWVIHLQAGRNFFLNGRNGSRGLTLQNTDHIIFLRGLDSRINDLLTEIGGNQDLSQEWRSLAQIRANQY